MEDPEAGSRDPSVEWGDSFTTGEEDLELGRLDLFLFPPMRMVLVINHRDVVTTLEQGESTKKWV